METMIVGKPAVNVYLPIEDTMNEGDVFAINNKIESVGNVGATCACLFKKWKMSVHFSGIIGNDGFAEKIRNEFGNYKVNVRYLETNFTSPTAANYIVLNSKTGVSSKILYNDTNVNLSKFKYDFMPDFAILDGSDIPGAIGYINSFPSSKVVLYANVLDRELITLSRKSTYVVSTQRFIEAATKEKCDGSVEGYVRIYQKVVDVTGASNYVVILNNHKILYSVDGQVKMLPEAKMNLVDSSSFDSIFVGTFSWAIANNVSVDDAIKLANTAASLSLAKIGEVDAIPEFDDVLDNSGLRAKLGMARATTAPIEPAAVTAIQPAPQEQVNNQDTVQPPVEAPTNQMPVQGSTEQVTSPAVETSTPVETTQVQENQNVQNEGSNV